MKWYALQTRPHQEDRAEQNLQRLGLETLSPRIKQEKIIRRVRRTVVSPLFPGYLFARFGMDAHYRAVSYARGVRRVVAFGSVPTSLPEATIESIRSRLDNGCVVIQPTALTPGQVVRIARGPLEGLEAVFEREMSDRQRVVLLLRALSYSARVVVALEDVVEV
jgi:transcriptional antiterminator RfaH